MPIQAFLTTIPLLPSPSIATPKCALRATITASLSQTIIPPSSLHIPSIETIDPFLLPLSTPVPTPPRRPVLIIPGYGADAKAYLPMAATLRDILGDTAHISIVPIRYHSWLSTFGGRPVTSIIELVHAAVQAALRETGADSVILVAHSAAGWISRIYLGDRKYPDEQRGHAWMGAKFVRTLICLGTPHRSEEFVTRKNMRFVNECYPGGFYPEVRYINLAGDGGSVMKKGGGWAHRFCRLSYRLTDRGTQGKDVMGDGRFHVVVTCFCLLE